MENGKYRFANIVNETLAKSAYLPESFQMDTTMLRSRRNPLVDIMEGKPALMLPREAKTIKEILSQEERMVFQTSHGEFLPVLFTPRQFAVMKHMAAGSSNKEIAAELGVSDQTVKNHVTDVFKKLQVSHRTEAVVKSIKLGLLPHPQK